MDRIIVLAPKGQIKLKADWPAVDSPKKPRNAFHVLGLSGRIYRASICFGFIWPLEYLILKVLAWEICNVELEFDKKKIIICTFTNHYYILCVVRIFLKQADVRFIQFNDFFAGVTVLLAFSVFMLAIAEKMPETSESIPLIGKFFHIPSFCPKNSSKSCPKNAPQNKKSFQ